MNIVVGFEEHWRRVADFGLLGITTGGLGKKLHQSESVRERVRVGLIGGFLTNQTCGEHGVQADSCGARTNGRLKWHGVGGAQFEFSGSIKTDGAQGVGTSLAIRSGGRDCGPEAERRGQWLNRGKYS